MHRRIYCDRLIDDETETLVLGSIVLKSVDRDRKMVEENNTEIEFIEKDLVELKEVMQDIGLVVSSQGEEINEAEENVDQADTNIMEGTKVLEKADEKASAIRHKKIAAKVMVTAIGAGIGALVAGPVGFAISLKIGAITTGLGTALGAGVATWI